MLRHLVLVVMLVLVIPFVSATWCYQETANVSTACGGESSGTYSLAGPWKSLGNSYDGLWNTYGVSAEGGAIETLYIIVSNINIYTNQA